MRLSHFWTLMNDEFGVAYARSLARNHHLTALSSQTIEAAIESGVPLRAIWEAVVEDMQIPPERALGIDHAPRPAGRE